MSVYFTSIYKMGCYSYCPLYEMDMWTAVLHELGHFAGLDQSAWLIFRDSFSTKMALLTELSAFTPSCRKAHARLDAEIFADGLDDGH